MVTDCLVCTLSDFCFLHVVNHFFKIYETDQNGQKVMF